MIIYPLQTQQKRNSRKKENTATMKQKRQKKSSLHTVAMLSYVPSFNSSIV